MSETRKKFNSPPKRFQPKGITVLYEDADLLVIDKTSGLLTVSTEKVKENTAYFLLTNYVKRGNQKSKNRVFIVHRLDRDTSGVIVFAKSEEVKRFLQDQWPEFTKKYFAIVRGALPQEKGSLTTYLAENAAHKVYSTENQAQGKLSTTEYQVIKRSGPYTLLELELLTGRKNQIRVHLSDLGTPVVGDRVYGEAGKDGKRLALHSASLQLIHPHTKKPMTFEAPLPAYFKSLVR